MKLHLNKVEMVLLDIGKTIYDKEKQIKLSEKVIESIKRLKLKGIKVGVCSMRTYKSCLELIPEKLDFYICLNGSYVVCNDKLVINNRIKNIFSNEYMLTYSDSKTFYKNKQSLIKAKENGFLAEEQGEELNPYVVTLFDVYPECIDSYKQDYKTTYWEKHKTLTLQTKDSSKLNALENILKILEINNFIFFADGPNDLEIFKKYKCGIMVKNGYPLLKKYCIDECEECNVDGLYNYLVNKNII